MELSKNDTKMLQGLSVLAMVCLHLFDRSCEGLFQPLIFFDGTPLSFYIGQLSDFCVFGFAFLSGYGHFIQSDRPNFYRRRLNGLLLLLCNFWIIVCIFCLVSFGVGNGKSMPGSFGEFILNMLTLKTSYNGAWWYMFTYILLVFLSPILMRIVKKIHPIFVIGIGFFIYCIAYYVRFNVSEVNLGNDALSAIVNEIFEKFGPFGMTLFEYLLGAVCCKLKLISKLYNIWKKPKSFIRWFTAIALIIIMLYAHTKVISSLFIAPITGFIIMMLFHFWRKPKIIVNSFLFIGKHSTNIWLTHMFFYLYIFENFVYTAKYPIFIFIFMIAITVFVSIILNFIEKPIIKQFSKI